MWVFALSCSYLYLSQTATYIICFWPQKTPPFVSENICISLALGYNPMPGTSQEQPFLEMSSSELHQIPPDTPANA